ncbi:hypothetical protein AB0B50_04135 [Streptomyces sp. NPDC041068]|uniref:hypothetical protein n=1 Tax=Streptomyces sp. NPDC041068 TaxID=3155130 RepID=UPI0033CDAE56
MIDFMNTVGEPARTAVDQDASLTKTRRTNRRVLALTGVLVAAALGAVVWWWAPWVDRDPFTAYDVSVALGKYTESGSTAGSCIRTASSEEETVIYDEDGHKLAVGRDPKEGQRLGPEFGDFAGDCMFITRVDGVPGGEGTYVRQWGGGTKTELGEDELRMSVEEQRERFKTMKKN